jgi:hypothetical protein
MSVSEQRTSLLRDSLQPSTNSDTLSDVFKVAEARAAVVEALTLSEELAMAGVPVSPAGHGGQNGYDKIVIQENGW